MNRAHRTLLLVGCLTGWYSAVGPFASAQPTCPLGCDDPVVGYPNKVNIEFRPETINAVLGQLVELGLYLVPDVPGATEEISAVQVILNWDPSKLRIRAHQNNDPNDPDLYQWLFAGFSNDAALDNVNDGVTSPPLGVPNNDGDAFFEALAQFPPPVGKGSAPAPPEGLLVTTLRFQAVGLTLSTELTIPPFTGDFTCTFVGWGVVSCDLKRLLGTARIRITATPYLPGDGDSDGDVDLTDFALFQACADDGGVDGDCWIFDFDLDLDVDFHDFAGLQIAAGS